MALGHAPAAGAGQGQRQRAARLLQRQRALVVGPALPAQLVRPAPVAGGRSALGRDSGRRVLSFYNILDTWVSNFNQML